MYTDDLNNISPASQAQAIFDLKETMKLAGYTVRASGDGIAAHSAVGDIITSSGSGANGMNNTNAWFTIRQPAGGSAPYSGTREWTFQRSTLSYTWFCEYSGPDTTFDQTTGTATVRPVGLVAGQVKSFTPNAGADSILPSTTNFTYQIRVGDSSENFHWYLQCYPLGGGTTNGRVMFVPMSSNSITPTEDEPFIMCATINDLLGATIGASSGNANFFGWQGKNGTINAWAEINSWVLALAQTGAALFPNGSGTNPDNQEDDSIPMYWGRRAAAGSGGLKGATTVLRWPSNDRETGAVFDSANYIHFDDVIMPWDGSTGPYL
jgi:hypothetical protein